MKFSPWVLLMLGNHLVKTRSLIKIRKKVINFFQTKKAPKMAVFVDGDP